VRATQIFSVSQLEGRDTAAQIRALGQQIEQLIRCVNTVSPALPVDGRTAGQLDAVWLVTQMGLAGANTKLPHNLQRTPVGALLVPVPLAGGELSRPVAIEIISADAQFITIRSTGTSRTLLSDTVAQTLANSTVKTAFDVVRLPADLLNAGDVIRYRWHGRYSTTGTPNLTLFVEWDSGSGTPLNGAVATSAGAAGAPVMAEGSLTIELATAAGTSRHNGIRQVAATLAAVTPVQTTGLALNAARTLTFSMQWGTASASNTVTHELLTVELISAVTPVARLLLF
jgi:hypothetical protein